jgi:hypothetical protein
MAECNGCALELRGMAGAISHRVEIRRPLDPPVRRAACYLARLSLRVLVSCFNKAPETIVYLERLTSNVSSTCPPRSEGEEDGEAPAAGDADSCMYSTFRRSLMGFCLLIPASRTCSHTHTYTHRHPRTRATAPPQEELGQ